MPEVGLADGGRHSAAPPGTAALIDVLVRADLARQVWQQLRRCPVPLIVSVVLTVAELLNLGAGSAALWWAVVALLDVGRSQVANTINGRRLAAGPDPHYLPRNIAHFATFGLVWGSLPLVVGQRSTPDATWFSLLVVLAVITVLVVVVAANGYLFAATLAAICVPLAIGFGTGALPGGVMALFTFAFFVIALYVHSTLHAAVVTASRSTIESRMLAERLAEILALEDPLTGLLNRAGLGDWLDREARGRHGELRVGVAVGNVERLAILNDIFGVAHGDAVLRSLARRLQGGVGDHVAVARIGGDEFALVGIAPDGDLALRDHLLRAVVEPFEVDGQLLDLSLSTASVAGSPRELDALLAAASSQVHEERQLRAQPLTLARGQVDGRRRLLDDLRDAMVAGQIVPWFQPIVSFADRRVHGFEALARWEHPERGTLGPDVFLGLVAVAGLHPALTERMLAGAAGFAQQLRAEGLPELAVMHVNLTAGDVSRTDLLDQVRRILADHDLPASSLVIEITEQDVPRLDGPLLGNLARLEELGVPIAIDDFGTGYSSFSHLLDIRADQLKIDKAFVEGLPGDHASVTVVRAILGLAGGLGLHTVAEGVERAEQADFLDAHGCDAFQGFLVAPALPPAEARAVAVAQTSAPSATSPVDGLR